MNKIYLLSFFESIPNEYWFYDFNHIKPYNIDSVDLYFLHQTTSCLAVTASIPFEYHLKSEEVVPKNPDVGNKIFRKSTILRANRQVYDRVSDLIDYLGERYYLEFKRNEINKMP